MSTRSASRTASMVRAVCTSIGRPRVVSVAATSLRQRGEPLRFAGHQGELGPDRLVGEQPHHAGSDAAGGADDGDVPARCDRQQPPQRLDREMGGEGVAGRQGHAGTLTQQPAAGRHRSGQRTESHHRGAEIDRAVHSLLDLAEHPAPVLGEQLACSHRHHQDVAEEIGARPDVTVGIGPPAPVDAGQRQGRQREMTKSPLPGRLRHDTQRGPDPCHVRRDVGPRVHQERERRGWGDGCDSGHGVSSGRRANAMTPGGEERGG